MIFLPLPQGERIAMRAALRVANPIQFGERRLSVGATPTRKGAGGLVNPNRLTANRQEEVRVRRWPPDGSIVTISGQGMTFQTGFLRLSACEARICAASLQLDGGRTDIFASRGG